MIQGFLPFSRATIMFDVVVIALVAFLPMLAWSISLARRGRYRLHKRVQLSLAVTLFVTVLLFEVDVQWTKFTLEGGWRSLSVESPYQGAPIDRLLRVHLGFATVTAVLWLVTTLQAVANFPKPPVPGPHSRNHKWMAWAATVGLFVTSITGWTFYYMAFVATQ